MIAEALTGIGSSLIGGLVGSSGIQSQNIANARQAQLNREFQANQSSTAHQRQVADMRKAGLNPILSATGGKGASTAAGAQARLENELEPIANSAKQALKLGQEIRLVKAQADKVENDVKAGKPAATIGDTTNDVINYGLEKVKQLTGVNNAKDADNKVTDLTKFFTPNQTPSKNVTVTPAKKPNFWNKPNIFERVQQNIDEKTGKSKPKPKSESYWERKKREQKAKRAKYLRNR